ncbi:MAG: DNA repair protein [Candidatus Muiribacteriota bacterium]
MSEYYTKAQFWKCALQVNPSSYIKYRGEEQSLSEDDYNNQLLKICLEEKIKIIGLADHGNVDAIDKIRTLFSEKDIIVFPGFEISSTEKIHFVCLFSENTTKDELNRYLGALELTNPSEKIIPSKLGGDKLISKIEELGGFCYVAHAIDDNGILKQKCNHIWKNNYLKAAQIPGSIDELSDEDKNKYKQILENKNPEYKREYPIAIINAKDVEKPETLKNPKASCLIKMTKPCFEAFKLAFKDPTSRIRLNSDVSKNYYSQIVSLKITNGYLDNVNIDFSEHLNSIIGGRGTGKSTLIECLRYAMDIKPIGNNALKQHNEIIKENIGKLKARIELKVKSSKLNGKIFTISRRYPELPIVKDENGEISSFAPIDILPEIEIFGQNEIYEIAQDKNLQKKLLSRFLGKDFEHNNSNIYDSIKKLSENRKKIISGLNDLSEIEQEITRLPKLEEQVKHYKSLGIESKLKFIPYLEIEKQLVDRIEKDEISNINSIIENIKDNLPDTLFLNNKTENLPDKELVKNLKIKLDLIKSETENLINSWEQKTNPIFKEMNTLLDELKNSIKNQEDNLDKTFKELPSCEGKTGREIGIEFQKLLSDIEKIKPKKISKDNKTNYIDELKKDRQKIIEQLSKYRADRTAHFEKAIKSLKSNLKGKLKITVNPEADRTPLLDFLIKCNLEGVGEKRLSWILENDDVTPIKLADLIIKGKDALLNEKKWGITPSTANSLEKMKESEIFEMEELDLPDTIKIELNISHDEIENYKPLEKLSTGQQCTAILHLLLLDNNDPLIMDQPEDNLDNAFIADRIVTQLRKEKMNRQFIFATHNANIPVFGDAEWIGVFESNDNQGFIPENCQGSIDVPIIRDKTAEILEGGKNAFNQRKYKYGF